MFGLFNPPVPWNRAQFHRACSSSRRNSGTSYGSMLWNRLRKIPSAKVFRTSLWEEGFSLLDEARPDQDFGRQPLYIVELLRHSRLLASFKRGPNKDREWFNYSSSFRRRTMIARNQRMPIPIKGMA